MKRCQPRTYFIATAKQKSWQTTTHLDSRIIFMTSMCSSQSLKKIASLWAHFFWANFAFLRKIAILRKFCYGLQFLRKFATLWSAIFCKVRKFCNLCEDIHVFPLKFTFSALGWRAINFCANWDPYMQLLAQNSPNTHTKNSVVLRLPYCIS